MVTSSVSLLSDFGSLLSGLRFISMFDPLHPAYVFAGNRGKFGGVGDITKYSASSARLSPIALTSVEKLGLFTGSYAQHPHIILYLQMVAKCILTLPLLSCVLRLRAYT